MNQPDWLRRGAVVGGVILYLFLMRWSYVTWVVPEFAYLGFVYTPVPLWCEVVSFLIALGPAVFLPIGLKRPSWIVLWLLYVVAFIPAITIPQYSPNLSNWEAIGLSAGLATSFAMICLPTMLPRGRFPVVQVPPAVLAVLFGVVAAGLYGMVIRVFGLHLRPPSLSEVYNTRAAYSQEAAASGGAVGYAMSWLAKVINPLLISLGLLRRNLLMLLAGMAGQVLLYSTTGLKGSLFGIVLLVAVLIAMRGKGRNFGVWCVWGVVAVVITALSLDALMGTRIFTSLFVRRVLITPGRLTGLYFEFFRSHPKTLLANGLFAPLAEYPYPTSPTYLIGSTFIRDETSANANLWATGYAAFGVPGMMVFSLILGLVLWVYDSVARDCDLRLTVLLLAMPSMALANTALPTTLFSHGLLLAIIIIYLMSGTSLVTATAAPARRGVMADAEAG